MNKLVICSRGSVSRKTSKNNITHILSLLEPGVKPFLHPKFDRTNWRIFFCDDVTDSRMLNAPTIEIVQHILNWGRNLPADANVLVHCEAGMSRSPAAALLLLVQERGLDKIQECIDYLMEIRPIAMPNSLIVKYGDMLLGANNALYEASEELIQRQLKKYLIKV